MGAVISDPTFLALGRQLATVGYSAYASTVLALTDQQATVGSNTAALTYAAQILDTESQHEGNLRQLCINLALPQTR
jgi:hypothetical protein